MMELLTKGRVCPSCGAGPRLKRADEAAWLEGWGGVSIEARVADALARAPRTVSRERSGLAHAAGFAGVLFLFNHSLAPLAFSLVGESAGLAAALLLALSLPAPLALALSFAAAAALDGSPRKSGALPALFGYAVGLFGSVKALYAFALWAAAM